LLPGTELSFEAEVKCESNLGFGSKGLSYKVARFLEVDKDKPNVHQDALEMPDGQVVLVTKLIGGQRAMVLQLPVDMSQTAAKTQPTSSGVAPRKPVVAR
jgi:hypothetical protein